MADENAVRISFPDLSAAEASSAATELAETINRGLREEGLPEAAEQKRVQEAAQNTGEIIQIILAAPAVLAMAHGVAIGIQKYMSRPNRGRIVITRPDGTYTEITDVESRHIEKVVAKLR
jgi:hypothetical protein